MSPYPFARRSGFHSASCTCGWWDLFPSEQDAQKAVDKHHQKTNHFELRITPPRGQEPKDPRHIR